MFAISKKKYIQRELFQIVCPYCYEKFEHTQVHFRALKNRHLENNGEADKPVIDLRLTEYRSQYNLDTAKTAPVIAPDNDVSESGFIMCYEKGYNRDGLLVEVIDQFNNSSKERLCPRCHNVLPKSAGKTKSTIIAFLGDTSVGKTVYMTTLINKLQTEVSVNFDADCIPIDDYTRITYENKFFMPMYQNGILPTSTRSNELSYPLIFEVRIGRIYLDEKKESWEPEKTITLAFYDIAGEGMRDRRYLDTFGKHLRFSDAYIFLIDPLQTAIAARINEGIAKSTGFTAKPPKDNRDSAIGIMYAVKSNDSIDFNKPCAVVLTKSDLLKNLNSEYIHESSNIFRKANHTGSLDMSIVESVHEEVKQLLQKADHVFLHHVDRSFMKFKLFAVSSLGGSVETDINGINKIQGERPDPIRVEEPFLWILCKLGYIQETKSITAGKNIFGFFKRR